MIFWIIYYSFVHVSLFETFLRGIFTRFLMTSSICRKVQIPKNSCSDMFYAVHLWTESKFLNSKPKGSVNLRKSRIKVRHMSYFKQSFKYFYIIWWWWWWWVFLVVWLTDERRLAICPAGAIVRNSHHRESPTRFEQDLNLHRTWV